MFNKILCIDDDPITLMLCKKVIIKSQFSKEIDLANNGEKALHYFDNLIAKILNVEYVISPELIFLDLNMPIMNGWEFLNTFSKPQYNNYFSTVRIIILSSTIDPKDVEKSKQFPIVTHFLSKPITQEMLYDLK